MPRSHPNRTMRKNGNRGNAILPYIALLVLIVLIGFIAVQLINDNDRQEDGIIETITLPQQLNQADAAVDNDQTTTNVDANRMTSNTQSETVPSVKPTTESGSEQLSKNTRPIDTPVQPEIRPDTSMLTNIINEWLGGEYLIARFVAVVNSVAEGHILYNQLFMPYPEEPFKADVVNEVYSISDANYQRYDVYINLLQILDPEIVEYAYSQSLPELETAFADLGYANVTFQQRMKEALIFVISAEVPQGTRFELKKPDMDNKYFFVDESVEFLTSVQKLFVRIGPDNTQIIKDRFSRLLEVIENFD